MPNRSKYLRTAQLVCDQRKCKEEEQEVQKNREEEQNEEKEWEEDNNGNLMRSIPCEPITVCSPRRSMVVHKNTGEELGISN